MSREFAAWRLLIQTIWSMYPRMVYFANLDNEIVVLGGYVRDDPRANNDNSPTVSPLR